MSHYKDVLQGWMKLSSCRDFAYKAVDTASAYYFYWAHLPPNLSGAGEGWNLEAQYQDIRDKAQMDCSIRRLVQHVPSGEPASYMVKDPRPRPAEQQSNQATYQERLLHSTLNHFPRPCYCWL